MKCIYSPRKPQGSIEFYHKGILIRVPCALRNAVLYKSDSFWDWLVSKYYNSKYIGLCERDIVDDLTFGR